MGYENDQYRDEDGEPLMDYDDVQSEGEGSPLPIQTDDIIDDEEGELDWRERSQTPVFDTDKAPSSSKSRKRLVKKSDKESSAADFALDDEVDEVAEDFETGPQGSDGVDAYLTSAPKRKKSGDGGSVSSSRQREKSTMKGIKREEDAFKYRGKGDTSKYKKGSMGYSGRGKDHEGDQEVKEMWDTIAGGDSEDDHDGVRTMDDDNFIDDTGVDPADRYGSDNDHSPRHAPQAEEGYEEEGDVAQFFSKGKKKKKVERSAAEVAMLVERVMADLEVTAEEDAELNRQSKPAVNKLIKLPLLTDVLSKKQLQLEFLDHGVLTLLKNWLEPLPDGSLPNINIREAILRILTDFPIDLEQYDRREQLKKSGLGKVIMFLSKSDEETTTNRKLAKDLVDKWSRPIFNKSTRFEHLKGYENERMPYRRPTAKKPANNSGRMESRDDDLDLSERTQEPKSSQSSSRQHASRPEAMPLDFLIRPASKVDPDEIRARAKQVVHDQRRVKMNKKLQQLKAPKKKQLQATRISVEGRGMVKYL